MRVAIYCRVSTEEQTLEQQIEPCVRRCKGEGWDYGLFTEHASGAKETRPQLDLMLQALRKREYDALMVYKLDRLGRSLKHLLQITQELSNKKIPFISLSEGFDTMTPMGRFTMSIMGALAQMERELISERTKMKLNYLKSKGVRLGRPPGSKDKKPRRKSGYHLRWIGGRKSNPRGTIDPVNKYGDESI